MPDLEWVLRRGVAEIIVEAEFRRKLGSGKPLRMKQGFDPSKPNLHVGHAVGLRKLRQLQELGHQVVLIVGDWTARIGDPSGRDEQRQMLTREEVEANARTYMEQFFLIVDPERTEVRWQSEWYNEFSLRDLFGLAGRFTLAQLMQHETFRQRWEENRPLSMMELLYPLLQAYDSVAIRADVEFGGTDQKFNNLMGRELQAAVGQPSQDVFLVPLLAGLDGRKMSKSFGNTIDVTLPPAEMYGRTMALGDEQIAPYLEAVTDLPDAELEAIERGLAEGTMNPRDAKALLARELVQQFHGQEAGGEAEEAFVRQFREGELPGDILEAEIPPVETAVDLLVHAGLAASRSEARRLIGQGGVRHEGQPVEDPAAPAVAGLWQVGKRRFVRVRFSNEAPLGGGSARALH